MDARWLRSPKIRKMFMAKRLSRYVRTLGGAKSRARGEGNAGPCAQEEKGERCAARAIPGTSFFLFPVSVVADLFALALLLYWLLSSDIGAARMSTQSSKIVGTEGPGRGRIRQTNVEC